MANKPIDIVWSRAALDDLNRFAEFLVDSHPQLAPEIAEAVIAAADVLADLPMMGRSIAGQPYRQLVISARNGSYVLRYRVAKERAVILRVFHGREGRT